MRIIKYKYQYEKILHKAKKWEEDICFGSCYRLVKVPIYVKHVVNSSEFPIHVYHLISYKQPPHPLQKKCHQPIVSPYDTHKTCVIFSTGIDRGSSRTETKKKPKRQTKLRKFHRVGRRDGVQRHHANSRAAQEQTGQSSGVWQTGRTTTTSTTSTSIDVDPDDYRTVSVWKKNRRR